MKSSLADVASTQDSENQTARPHVRCSAVWNLPFWSGRFGQPRLPPSRCDIACLVKRRPVLERHNAAKPNILARRRCVSNWALKSPAMFSWQTVCQMAVVVIGHATVKHLAVGGLQMDDARGGSGGSTTNPSHSMRPSINRNSSFSYCGIVSPAFGGSSAMRP